MQGLNILISSFDIAKFEECKVRFQSSQLHIHPMDVPVKENKD